MVSKTKDQKQTLWSRMDKLKTLSWTINKGLNCREPTHVRNDVWVGKIILKRITWWLRAYAHIESIGSKWLRQGMLTRTTSHMELTIMQAGKSFKSNRLQRIFERSKSIPKNYVRHMNNWEERILDKCEEKTIRVFTQNKPQDSKLKGFSGQRRIVRGIL